LKAAADGLRPLAATADNATRVRLRFDTVTRTEAHHRGTGKPAQRALRAISSSREVAAWVRVIDALGTISSAPVAHEPNIADEIRERRAGTDIAGVIALNTGMAGAACSPA
jgi:hypothetical protein